MSTHNSIVLVGFMFIAHFIESAPQSNVRYVLLRLNPKTIEHVQYLSKLHTKATSHRLDFWTDVIRSNAPVDVMTDLENLEKFSKNLTLAKIEHRVTVEDVEKLIKRQGTPKKSWFTQSILRDDPIDTPFRVDKYNGYDKIIDFMTGLQSKYPHIVNLFSIGTTHEGRKMYVIKIGRSTGQFKRSIWIDAGIHAREWIAPSTAIYIINELVTRYNQDSQIQKYVDTLDWHILPVLNPDGYEYSRSDTNPKVRMWRKNRSKLGNCDGINCCDGVDLNRNFDFYWGETGASSFNCDEMYAGKFAFSEPETASIRNYLLPRANEFSAFITLHSYSQIWIYPYGFAAKKYPVDVADLHRIAIQAKQAIWRASGSRTRYLVGTGADTLYPASGGSEDWAKRKLSIKYSYLIELRPTDRNGNGFLLDEDQILPTGLETLEGIKVVADAVIALDSTATNDLTTTLASVDGIVTEFPSFNCRNESPQCSFHASIGFCESKSDVRETCKLACGLCDQSN